MRDRLLPAVGAAVGSRGAVAARLIAAFLPVSLAPGLPSLISSMLSLVGCELSRSGVKRNARERRVAGAARREIAAEQDGLGHVPSIAARCDGSGHTRGERDARASRARPSVRCGRNGRASAGKPAATAPRSTARGERGELRRGRERRARRRAAGAREGNSPTPASRGRERRDAARGAAHLALEVRRRARGRSLRGSAASRAATPRAPSARRRRRAARAAPPRCRAARARAAAPSSSAQNARSVAAISRATSAASSSPPRRRISVGPSSATPSRRRRIQSSATCAVSWRWRVRSSGKTKWSACVPCASASARCTRPTGFASLPPPGPEMPVVATARSAPKRARAPSAIARATGSDTAPCSREQRLGHAEQRALRGVGVGHDAAQEVVRRAGHVGELRRRRARPCTTRPPRRARRARAAAARPPARASPRPRRRRARRAARGSRRRRGRAARRPARRVAARATGRR